MTAIVKRWPNGLGYDVGQIEVFTGKDDERAYWSVIFGNGDSIAVPPQGRTNPDGYHNADDITAAVAQARVIRKAVRE